MTLNAAQDDTKSKDYFSYEDVPLEDICEFIMRGKHPDYVEQSDIKVLNQKALRWGNIENEHLKYHSEDTEIPNNRFVEQGDIVINSTGVGTLGRVYYFREDQEDMFVDSHITILRVDEDLVYPEYLYYILKSPEYQRKIENIAVGSTGQIELNKRELTQLEVSFPDKEVQEKIIEVIRPLDEKIQLNEDINTNLEEIVQTYYKYHFVDFGPYDNFVNTDFGRIPEEFSVVEIKELCDQIRNGGTPKKSNDDYWGGSIPWIKTGELDGMPIIESEEAITEEGLEENSCKIAPKNTVLVALYGASVGNNGLIRIPATFNQAACSLSAKSDVGYAFLFQSIKNLKDQLKQLSRGSAQQNISQGIIKEQQVALPPETDLSEFQEFANPLYDQIETNLEQNKLLRTLRDTLLPKLMSGEIRVNDISLEDLQVQ